MSCNVATTSPVTTFIDIQYLFKSTKQIQRKGESGFSLIHLFQWFLPYSFVSYTLLKKCTDRKMISENVLDLRTRCL